jgi:hypothetical protein
MCSICLYWFDIVLLATDPGDGRKTDTCIACWAWEQEVAHCGRGAGGKDGDKSLNQVKGRRAEEEPMHMLVLGVMAEVHGSLAVRDER